MRVWLPRASTVSVVEPRAGSVVIVTTLPSGSVQRMSVGNVVAGLTTYCTVVVLPLPSVLVTGRW